MRGDAVTLDDATPDKIVRVQSTSFTMAGGLLAYNGAETVFEMGRAHMPSGLETLVSDEADRLPGHRSAGSSRQSSCTRTLRQMLSKVKIFVVCALPHLLREAQRVL